MSGEREILTVGHSNHDERHFLDLLAGADVEVLADVRAQPRSRRNPQFNAGELRAALAGEEIDYVALGKWLGGRREPAERSLNISWEDPAFRGYADHMASEEFAEGLEQLERAAAERRVAVMCAEGDWRSCHRRLIADVLITRGWRVVHLLPDATLEAHELHENAVVGDDGITYPMPGQTSLEV